MFPSASKSPASEIEAAIEDLAQQPLRSMEALRRLDELRGMLNSGQASVVESSATGWRLHIWVKRGILLHAVLGGLGEVTGSRGGFWDLDTLPARRFRGEDAVRVVPGALVRDGSWIGPGSIILAGSSVAIGASLGNECQVDSGCHIGLCAHLGNSVFLEAGSRIGGVLNPAERFPAIIGDCSLLAMGAAVMGSVELGQNCVVGPGVLLSDSSAVWNAVSREWIRPNLEGRLVLPEGSVLLSGLPPEESSTRARLLMPILAGFAHRDEPAASAYRRICANA